MKLFSAGFFFLNLFLFILFTAITLTRYIMYPEVWSMMIRHPVQSLYLSCIPMGGSTLLTVAASLFYDEFSFGGTRFLYFLWGLWLFDVTLCFVCMWGLVDVMYVHIILCIINS
jgi:tellurite resistance protein TehA-like permease